MKQEFEKIITKLFALFITVMALTVIACKPEVETKIEYVDKIVYVDKTYAKPVTFTSTANDDGSVTVTMATETEGAAIYYTIDGSKPTTRSNIYTQAISFNLNTTIKAFAVKEGIEPSPVSAVYVSINKKRIIEYVDKTYTAPVTFVATDDGDGNVNLTMATATEGAVIYYTLDGTTPTKESNIYTGAISFNNNKTIKAFAVKEGIEPSPVSVASVSINEKTITEIQIEYVDKKADEIAPADVTNLTATAKDEQVLLSWTDAEDDDVYGYEVTYNGASAINRVAFPILDSKSMVVPQGAGGCYVSGLENGTQYTFTVKTVDTSGNKSQGVSANATPVIIEKNVMTITLTPSITDITKENITVTTSINTDAPVKTVKYASGVKTVSYFETAGTILTANEQGTYCFTVEENDTFTVFAQDTDGRRETRGITITNIDKVAPAVVAGVQTVYNDNKIILTWTNPNDSDFAYVSLSYTKDGSTIVSDEHITAETYTIDNVEADGSEYIFTLCTVDNVENTSEAVTDSIEPNLRVTVESIALSRYHLAYNDTDQTITAVAYLNNANLIEEDINVKIQIRDSSGNVTNTAATVDKTNGTATATLTVPASGSMYYNESKNYTVRCKVGDEAVDTEHTARFNVSGIATLSGVSQSLNDYESSDSYNYHVPQISLANVTDSTTETIRIKGYNLDLTTLAIQLYNSTGEAYFTEPVAVDTSPFIWTATSGTLEMQTVDTEIHIPTDSGLYTIKVLYDGYPDYTYTMQIQIYDMPRFTSFSIPKTSSSKEDSVVTAIIEGHNFEAPDVEAGNFTATCNTRQSVVADTSFTINSDSSLEVTFTIPGIAGEYPITVTYGEQSITGTLKVGDYGAYSVGDVLLNDGTIIPYDADNLSFTDEQKQNVVGILYGLNEYDAPLGYLGIHKTSDDDYNDNNPRVAWASSGTLGSTSIFPVISCDVSESYGGYRNKLYYNTVTGDIDGSDNWEYICSVDPEGTADAATNYPAFNYVNNYAATFGLTGNYAEDWYMPTLAEWSYINRSLKILNSILLALDVERIWQTEYWTSSTNSTNANLVYCVYPDPDLPKDYTKFEKYGMSYARNVCVVRPFE